MKLDMLWLNRRLIGDNHGSFDGILQLANAYLSSRSVDDVRFAFDDLVKRQRGLLALQAIGIAGAQAFVFRCTPIHAAGGKRGWSYKSGTRPAPKVWRVPINRIGSSYIVSYEGIGCSSALLGLLYT